MRGMRGMSGTGRGAGDANAVGGLSFGIGMRGTIGTGREARGRALGLVSGPTAKYQHNHFVSKQNTNRKCGICGWYWYVV